LPADVITGDADGSGGRFDESLRGAKGAGFAGSIGSQQPKNFTGLYFEGDPLDGMEFTIIYIQVFYPEDGLVM
jgi:hypothetical protein